MKKFDTAEIKRKNNLALYIVAAALLVLQLINRYVVGFQYRIQKAIGIIAVIFMAANLAVRIIIYFSNKKTA